MAMARRSPIVPLEPRLRATAPERLAGALSAYKVFRTSGPRAWSRATAADADFFARSWRAALGDRVLSEMTSLDVEALFMDRAQGGRSAAAVNKARGFLLAFLRWCERHQLVASAGRLLAAWPRLPDEPRRRLIVLPEASWGPLVAACSPRIRRAVAFDLQTGLRLGELLGLLWAMVVPDPAQAGLWLLSLPAALRKQRRGHVLPLTRKAVEVLGPRGADGDRVFPELPGKPWFERLLHRAAAAAGLDPGLKPHDLRRSWCTRLLDQGAPDAVVQRLGGWSATSVMVKHYHRLSLVAGREWIERLNARSGPRGVAAGPPGGDKETIG